MRGEICLGSASLLCFISLMLLIFVHVGQTNTGSVARGIAMVSINMTGYLQAMEAGTGDPAPGLFTNNATAPLWQGLGLRQEYLWGFYGHCAYTNLSHGLGICSNKTFGAKFTPFDVMLGDTPPRYNVFTQFIVPTTTFKDSGYLGTFYNAAFWLIFIATLAMAVSLVTGVIKNTWTFGTAAFFSIIATLCILIGASIFTAIISKTSAINTYKLPPTASSPGAPLGILVSTGKGVYMLWAAFALMLISIFPYTVSWVTFRR
ncbi:hypothetical protein BOTBODRAFT_26399 [Botryobasidium botryosum FD-172 SS1]|uniref:Actin cortical patch SUR7/pH-response regulator PalI n=1 Tax=Botryobasidium botryosum (strain FD-172 SS1) TaxID=930990 RepID=A0A067MXC9_BOTB1|nr:hypothetical protein BOTBODRAFT_26399 [Botryobasidium botryosum FD-172 SS1]